MHTGWVNEYLLVRVQIEIHGCGMPQLTTSFLPCPWDEHKPRLAWMNGTPHGRVIQSEPMIDVIVFDHVESEHWHIATLTKCCEDAPLHGHQLYIFPRTKVVGQRGVWYPTYQIEEVIVHGVQQCWVHVT